MADGTKINQPADGSEVHWPTLRSKLLPITVIRLHFWVWPKLHEFANWYYGNYWSIEFGPWIILGGACELRDTDA